MPPSKSASDPPRRFFPPHLLLKLFHDCGEFLEQNPQNIRCLLSDLSTIQSATQEGLLRRSWPKRAETVPNHFTSLLSACQRFPGKAGAVNKVEAKMMPQRPWPKYETVAYLKTAAVGFEVGVKSRLSFLPVAHHYARPIKIASDYVSKAPRPKNRRFHVG